MSGGLDEIGRMIGKALADRQDAPSVNVHVPRVEVSVDPMPLAEAVQAGHQQNVKALAGIGDLLTKAVAEAIIDGAALVPQADLSGLEHKMAMVVDAIAAHNNTAMVEALEALAAAVASNTRAVNELVAETQVQNRILKMPKTMTYDAQGRVSRIEVA